MDIKLTFLQNASEILGDTDNGLSGAKIVKYFVAKSVDYDIEIPHTKVPFDAPNKRTALFENLTKFSVHQQFEIIGELCDILNNENTSKLKLQLIERYSEGYKSEKIKLVSEKNDLKLSNEILSGLSDRLESKKVKSFEEFTSNQVDQIKPFDEFIKKNTTSNSNKRGQPFNEFINSEGKIWWKSPVYFVPILIALIGGLFTIGSAIIGNPLSFGSHKSNCVYELLFIDKTTERTPIFKSTTPRVRIYIETPPMIERIIDGTVCIKTDKSLESQLIKIELENIDDYTLVDRKQLLKHGINEILLEKKNSAKY